MSVIEVEALTKHYGAVVGVEAVSFTVEAGEIFGFLGPNGAGKTTTIRLLMQLLRPDRGRITQFGVALDAPNAALRERIGYLPGEFQPYLTMTGARFLAYMARYRRRPPVLRPYLLNTLHLTEKALKQPIKHLSHGNRQKLGIVLALEHEPDLAVLDEPTLGLDPLMQEAFYDILRLLHDKGKTIFLSSHVLSEVEKVCHRVAIVREGRLVALESLEALKKKRPRRLVVVLEETDASAPPVLPGARLLSHDAGRYEYLVEGAVRPVLGALAALPVQDVVFSESDLEDVFMAFYQESSS
jgi:ABC-2 type transport system ATP-binding protein